MKCQCVRATISSNTTRAWNVVGARHKALVSLIFLDVALLRLVLAIVKRLDRAACFVGVFGAISVLATVTPS